MLNILILTKRQYTNKDLVDDRFGRLWELPHELGSKSHQIQGLCLSYRKRSEGFIYASGTVTWESINAGPLKLPGLYSFFKRARECARTADVIWACSDSIYGIIGYYLSRRYNIPLVFDLFDNFEYFLLARLPVIKQAYRHVVRKCAAVTCVSNPLADRVREYRRHKNIFVVENAVSSTVFKSLNKKFCRSALNLPHGGRLIGTAGHLAQNRGIKHLFEAFDRLKHIHPDIHLVLAGPSSVSIPHDERIHYLGVLPMEKIPVVYNALDIAVICNSDNAFGRYCFPQKAREIMACDTPMIAAGVGSMQELFRDRPDWLYAPDNSSSLAEAIERRLNDKRTEYGPVAQWKDIANKLEEVFHIVCTGTHHYSG